MKEVRTWIEIDAKALRHNVGEFFRIIPSSTRFMAVIKSNAYGHGLVTIARELVRIKSFAHTGWFGVDSIVEALRLRREGISNPILVLGFTLPSRMEDAAREQISISISHFDALNALSRLSLRPAIHLKFDTGMHRQGFMQEDMSRLVVCLQKKNILPQGIFTHFASAKDPAYLTYTHLQLEAFNSHIQYIRQKGYGDIMCHAAATGGTLIAPNAHLDMVRIGMGLYGYWPSLETSIAERQKIKEKKIQLKPILVWKTRVSEVKKIPKDSFVGYDLTERVHRATTIALLPIGYWHGYDRGLSSIGEVLVRGKRARVLGRISMDMAVIDVTDIALVRWGDEVVIIGTQQKETISAEDIGRIIGTSAYEVLTRINPLIKRIVI